MASGHLAAAEISADRAVSWDPANIAIRLVLAQIDATAGTSAGEQAALAQTGAALAVSPTDPIAGQSQAQLLVQRAQRSERPGDWAAARRDLTRLVVRDPLNPQLWLDVGVVDAATNDDKAAARAWRSSAALSPGSAAPWSDLAVMDLGAGKESAASADARAALSRDPSDAPAEAVLARARSGSPNGNLPRS